MRKLFIPGVTPLFEDDDILPTAIRSAPMRAMVVLVGVEKMAPLLTVNKNGATVASEIERRGTSIEGLVREAIDELFADGEFLDDTKTTIELIVAHTARVGGPLSNAVREVLEDPAFSPSKSRP